MSELKIPSIDTSSKTKKGQYQKLTAQIPKDAKINFHDKNSDGNLDPKEWFEYSSKGSRNIYYSPHVSDTPESIAKAIGVDTSVVKSKVGKKVNPNSFLSLTVPEKKKAEAKVAEKKPTKTGEKKPTEASEKKPSETSPKKAVVSDSKLKGKNENGSYTVKRGDTLSALSSKLHTTVDELKSMNKLKNDSLQPNQVLQYKKNRVRNGFNSDIKDEQYLKALKANVKGEFSGHEQAILNAAKKHDIPVSDFYAIMAHETRHGTSDNVKIKHNPGGVRIKGSKEFETYKTLDEGIDKMAKLLSSYYKRGQDTLALIKPTYCPDNDSTNTGENQYWLGNTQKLKQKFLSSL